MPARALPATATEGEGEPPGAPTLPAIATVVVLGALLSILDTTVVNVAIDALARELDAPLATIQWVATGYLLALATTIPLSGWAADRFGSRRLFLAAVALFSAGSALCGAAWSAESLIAFRVVQGLGGGLILPAGITLIGQTAGPRRMARTMSAIGVPMLIAPMLGPLLGGGLLDAVSWRWIFLVNVPAGVVVLLLAARLLPRDPAPAPRQRLDWAGLALLSPGLAALVYGLARVGSGRDAPGANAGALTDHATALLPLLAGALLLAAFARHALRRDGALLDLRLLRERSVAAAAVALLLLGGAFLGALFLLPLLFQLARGESAFATGLLLLPQGAAAALTLALTGRLADRIGAGRVVLAGLLPFVLGLAALTRITATTPDLALAAALLLFGAGMGATMMPAMTAAYRTLERARVARATALLTIVQRLGSSLGVALAAVALGDGRAAADFASAFRWPLLLALAAVVPAIVLACHRPEGSVVKQA
ncbi:DHA2 family efflux MFS transporter permease subunit [Conexibacter stalactiti]|uniref:DHA2 family efflux MFS transporter permease subunit n=1 Tax=Conexibacter stalactiti TaxID=1940611 RepID=A0ABU4HSJ1_9ACTN|nr:DHA2 family efflux MFS transporter permease subunit [Conexibacter stalactiti]MDW5596205.1 DHA2 family efflux MFS transporter permease subunit [Conexibacter stalactiti]MEC5036847.1 DHA2 family efflux MFS transporter permease subunit [Conexibacter stalactiti]